MTIYFSGVLNNKLIHISQAQANRITQIAHAGGATGKPLLKILHNGTKLLINYDGKWHPDDSTARQMADVLGLLVRPGDIVWDE